MGYLSSKSEEYIINYFMKEFTIILVRILSLLRKNINFPICMEDLIFEIPDDVYWKGLCDSMYMLLYSEENENIKENIERLKNIYSELVKVQDELSKKLC